MKLFVTEINAIDPIDGETKAWFGPYVPGITKRDAEQYCQANGLAYCKIIGELVAEIPCKPGGFKPDFGNQTDYDNLN